MNGRRSLQISAIGFETHHPEVQFRSSYLAWLGFFVYLGAFGESKIGKSRLFVSIARDASRRFHSMRLPGSKTFYINFKSMAKYDESSITSLEWHEHIRRRPGMYVGSLGHGNSKDDGLYVLVKEVIDNAIDEHLMGHGKVIDITLEDNRVAVRDYGRGIPLGKIVECVAKMNTGGKYDSDAFQKSVGLNGVGTKAVNALSSTFVVQAFRDHKTKRVEFSRAQLLSESRQEKTHEPDGTLFYFEPDQEIFGQYKFKHEYIEEQLWNYAYLNTGLTIQFNGKKFKSKEGLKDLLTEKLSADELYPIVHLKGDDIEVAFTHVDQYGEEYYSFVNGQYTTQGGTHQAAFREAFVKVIREFYKKNFEPADVRQSITAAIAVRVQEPVFDSQTKTKLGSEKMAPDGLSMRAFVGNFIKSSVDNYLHRNPDVAEALHKKILQTERERKDLKGVQQKAREMAKKAKVHNKKLRDCKVHFDSKAKNRDESSIFITEGDSAAGSITSSRNPETQAVFGLKGKPFNCFGQSKAVVYKNEELNLLQHALNIEDGLDGLRYNKVIMATDADVDGAHIRLLLLTFFLQFFPDLVKQGHLYVLETPLFRVRNKRATIYCYDEAEKNAALQKLKGTPEVTRFKGLGEVSANEFETFIGKDMRLEPVILPKFEHSQQKQADPQNPANGHFDSLHDMLEFYMGTNTPQRQEFVLANLKTDVDSAEV